MDKEETDTHQLVAVRDSRRVKSAVFGTEREPGNIDEAEGGSWHGCDGGLTCGNIQLF